MSKASAEALDALHGALAEQLLARVRSGEATAAELAVVCRFLKDNGIEAIPGNPRVDDLARALTEAGSLPFPGEATSH